MRVISESPSEILLEGRERLQTGSWFDWFMWGLALMLIAGAVACAKLWWLEGETRLLLWAITCGGSGLYLVSGLLFPGRERWRFDGSARVAIYTFAPFPGIVIKRRTYGLPTKIEHAYGEPCRLKVTLPGDLFAPQHLALRDADEAARVAKLLEALG